MTLDVRFQQNQYLVRKQFFKFLGDAFRVYDVQGNLLFYSRLKAFKLKEDIRIYSGEDMQYEMLRIKARKILDISSAYDVYDSMTDTKIGALKRKGIKSLLQDEWLFLDNSDAEIGRITEDMLILAIVRRVIGGYIPQSYDGSIGGVKVCEFKQNWNPFLTKITLDFRYDTQGLLDRRLGVAAAVLLCGIEGKQT